MRQTNSFYEVRVTDIDTGRSLIKTFSFYAPTSYMADRMLTKEVMQAFRGCSFSYDVLKKQFLGEV